METKNVHVTKHNVLVIEHNGHKVIVAESTREGFFHIAVDDATYNNVTEQEVRTLLKAAGIE
jgi:hypothetical protein